MKKGRTQVEILADILGEYQERCAESRRLNDTLVLELVRLREMVKELGGDPDGKR